VFRIGGNTFYDQKNKILMKIPEFKRSGIGLTAEFCRIPKGLPNQAYVSLVLGKLGHDMEMHPPLVERRPA
jgi:hypothetical protein